MTGGSALAQQLVLHNKTYCRYRPVIVAHSFWAVDGWDGKKPRNGTPAACGELVACRIIGIVEVKIMFECVGIQDKARKNQYP